MVLLKTWFDIRQRFYSTLIFFLAIAVLHVLFFPLLKQMGADFQEELQILKSDHVQRLVNDYNFYTTERWFKEVERNVIFGILLALGGVLVEARTKTILVTLSLPPRRRTWMLAQFGLVLLLLLTMNICALLFLAGAAPYFGADINPFHALLGAFLLVLATSPYVAMTLLFSSITNDSLRAGIYSFAFLIFSNQLDRFGFAEKWMPENITELLTTSAIPWQSFVTILVVTAVSLAYTIRKFENTDF